MQLTKISKEENAKLWEENFSDVPDNYQFMINSGTER